MKVWLLRHGQAGPYVRTGDHLRELTDLGRREAQAAAAHLPADLALVVCSPYVRARQTAAEVIAQLPGEPELQICDGITPDDSARDALTLLQTRQDEEFLVVSHQPIIGALAGLLLHGHLQQPVTFQTGTLVCLEGEMLLAGLMNLRSIHNPGLF